MESVQGGVDERVAEQVRLGGYTLLERVGEGGMGFVHRAVDAQSNTVAVKLLRPNVASDVESRQRFAREARVLARVRGDHVAEVIDSDLAAETPYLVTRFVSGPPLHDVVAKQGVLSGADLADLAGDLADALCSIHSAGVVHRDLKPGNVLIHDGIAVVIDFGIAQIADETRLTMPGMVYGTPGYVAPEVLSGGAVTPAADIHAWATTVTFAATNRAPFGKGGLTTIAYRVLNDDVDLTGCPPWLVPVLRRCLAKDPLDRPTAPELLLWLEEGEEPDDVRKYPAGRIPTVVVPVRQPVEDGTPQAGPEIVQPYDWTREPPSPTRQYTAVAPSAAAAPSPSTGQLPVAEPSPPVKAQSGPFNLARADQRNLHPVVTVLLFGTLTALAATLPIVALVALVCWLLGVRMVDRATLQLERRRTGKGRRRSDGWAVAGAMPWHGTRSLLFTTLTLPVALAGAFVVAAILVLGMLAGNVTPPLALVTAVGALGTAALAWWGIEGESVQRGSLRVLNTVLKPRWLAITVAALLSVAIIGLLTLATVEPVNPWPFGEFHLPGRLGDLVGNWIGAPTQSG